MCIKQSGTVLIRGKQVILNVFDWVVEKYRRMSDTSVLILTHIVMSIGIWEQFLSNITSINERVDWAFRK